jgi:hypothetical protein
MDLYNCYKVKHFSPSVKHFFPWSVLRTGPAPFLRRAAETVQVQITLSPNGKYYVVFLSVYFA